MHSTKSCLMVPFVKSKRRVLTMLFHLLRINRMHELDCYVVLGLCTSIIKGNVHPITDVAIHIMYGALIEVIAAMPPSIGPIK